MNAPVAPKRAASVILLDESRGGGEPFGLFLLRRGGGSSFMPGRYVFPGGGLDQADCLPGGGPSLEYCAIRELWEEAGVILAKGTRPPCDLSPRLREEARVRLIGGGLSLAEALAGLDLEPDPGALVPFGRWITPEARSKRFDTTFFLARMDDDQTAACDFKETNRGVWLGTRRALEENESGEVFLAPPQVRLIGELTRASSLAELFGRTGDGVPAPVLPVLWADGRERTILLPWDPDYAQGRPLRASLACPAADSTRVVEIEGRWLPRRAG